MSLKLVRGTKDIFENENMHFRKILNLFREVSERYGYKEISTPIIEYSEVFEKTLGESSDVVSKEMYKFKDRSGNNLTLRPEGTAGIARAFISGKMKNQLPIRFLYNGPMFRYERPQKGRFRQFHQIGVELLGVSGCQADVEVIALGYHILKDLGLIDKVSLLINSLGDFESRENYKKELIKYLNFYKSDLSKESLIRLDKNPLRILDSKNETDIKILENAPKFIDFLNQKSKSFFDETCKGLEILNIPFDIDANLVRGFDYYCHTAFEFVTKELGSQNAVIAGGRYDGLISSMGGEDTPGVGWAAGLERLGLLIPEVKDLKRPVSLLSVSNNSEILISKLASELRYDGFIVNIISGGNISKSIQKSNKIKSKYVIIVGEEELESGLFPVKDLDTGEQNNIILDEICTFLRGLDHDRPK
ncbi:MAG: Histidine--tRNA ligase [Alphaproteobacteria bacterium MarineAlpha2_Bin1]|nr:MAG: Histidine--tRNA ligase [Alphaproteobacteria bacterium MarineAlpha2_Bin1]